MPRRAEGRRVPPADGNGAFHGVAVLSARQTDQEAVRLRDAAARKVAAAVRNERGNASVVPAKSSGAHPTQGQGT